MTQSFTPGSARLVAEESRELHHAVHSRSDGTPRPLATEIDAVTVVPSPDGSLLAVSDKIVRLDGSVVARISGHPHEFGWSPDGRRVVFQSRGSLVLYDFERRDTVLIATMGRPDFAWSPDGTRFAIAQITPARLLSHHIGYPFKDLFIFDSDGSLERLVARTQNTVSLVWS